MEERTAISCGESADIQTAVIRSAKALHRNGDLDEIPEVVDRLKTEAGWPLEIVQAITELTLSGNL